MIAHFTFLPDLNIFLSSERQKAVRDYEFASGQSVKHLIESAGVPHTEVGMVEVHDTPVEMDYQVQPGDQVIVHPPLPGSGTPPELRFVLDNHLGRLAAYLRMLGLDSLYRNDYQDEELAQIADEQDRVLLTRDRRLLMRRVVRWGYCPRSLDSRAQLAEVVKRYALTGQVQPFRRCLSCNHPLQPVEKQAVLHRLEPLTRLYFDEFHLCPNCGQVYWKGSHYDRMIEIIKRL